MAITDKMPYPRRDIRLYLPSLGSGFDNLLSRPDIPSQKLEQKARRGRGFLIRFSGLLKFVFICIDQRKRNIISAEKRKTAIETCVPVRTFVHSLPAPQMPRRPQVCLLQIKFSQEQIFCNAGKLFVYNNSDRKKQNPK